MKELMKNQPADNSAAQQADKQQSAQPNLIQVREEIFRMEQVFRDMQERYDLFVMRHYGQRYEPWFEEISDRYRLRIRRLYFRLLKLDRMERELRENQTNGRVSPTATAQTKPADKADTLQARA